MVACNSSTFANTTCADNVLGDIVEVRYTNTSSKAVQLCEIIIAGQTSGQSWTHLERRLSTP